MRTRLASSGRIRWEEDATAKCSEHCSQPNALRLRSQVPIETGCETVGSEAYPRLLWMPRPWSGTWWRTTAILGCGHNPEWPRFAPHFIWKRDRVTGKLT